jgi:two-component system chemotaxis response regulator CheY
MKVLVVDDSSTMRRIIINTLKSAGYPDVDEAGDGAEALGKVDGVGLILTDWNMPVMDGLTFVKEVRGKGITTPIIMVTTEGAKNEVLEALKNGVNDYIVKPFTKPVMVEKITKVLGQ